jgi:hypothetical protein
MIIHNPILTGSFTVNGTDVASITSSAASLTSLNAYTASQNILNGTYTLTSSFAAQTASFTAFTSSVNSFTASQLVLNGTYATTGSNTFAGIQTINSNLTVTGSITAQTLIVSTINATQSYSSGSNIFGNNIANTQTFTGSVNITGSTNLVGSLKVNKIGINTGNINLDNFSTSNLIVSGAIAFANAGGGAAALVDRDGSGNTTFYGGSGDIKFTDLTMTSNYLTIKNAGNVGIGVIPSAWYTGYTALQVGFSGAIWSNKTSADTNTTMIGNNAYLNSGATNWIYQNNGFATRYTQVSGEHQFYTTASGTAGAAITWTQAMTLNSSGNLGIGTSSPSTLFHTYSATDNLSTFEAGTSSGVQIRFKHGSTQTAFINSSASSIFSIYQSTGTEKFTLGSNGQFNFYHLGDAPITNDLYGNIIVNSNGSGFFSRIRFDVTTTPYWGLTRTATSNDFSIGGRIGSTWSDNVFRIYQASGNVLIGSLGTGTVYATSGVLSISSDKNLKNDDGGIENALSKVLQLNPRYFHWKEESGLPTDIRQLGFYAQDVNAVLGEEVANTPKDGNDKWGIYDRALIAMLTKAIQEQQAQITELKNK